MIEKSDEGLVSPSDIADIAGVSRGAVSNWRKRAKSFPAPVAGTSSKPLFSLKEVTHWLERHASKPVSDARIANDHDAGDMHVWAALNLLRGQLAIDDAADLILALACARKNGEDPVIDVPNVAPEVVAQVIAAVNEIDIDELGAAVDFTLERLARSQGKVGADFGFVGSRTTTLLANLAAPLTNGVLYDPACGIAAAILEAVKLGARPERSVGHDINQRALRIAAQRAALQGVDLEVACTNVLAEDIDPTLRAEVILLEPPFGMRLNAAARLTDARFDFGPPPRTSADTAWLQHAVAHLTDTGRAYVLTPVSTLFRGGEEGRIRTELVRRGCVEAIVGLPGKLLPQTSIPLALWVLRRPVRNAGAERVLLIDAAETVSPENFVRDWLTDRNARENVPHIEVPITDLLASESGLAPQRWVDRTEREPGEVNEAYQDGLLAIKGTMTKLEDGLSSFGGSPSFSKSRVMTVGELVDQGILELRLGRPKDRYEDLPEELRVRIATASDVRDGNLREIGVPAEYPDYPEMTVAGDVLVTTMNTIRARVDNVGGHLPATGVYRLRVRDPEVLTPTYLSIALTGSWNERFQGGSTIQRASIKELEVPLVPMSEQREIQNALLSIYLLHARAAHLAEQTSAVATALLDSVRYNVALTNPTSFVGRTDQGSPEDSEGAK